MKPIEFGHLPHSNTSDDYDKLSPRRSGALLLREFTKRFTPRLLSNSRIVTNDSTGILDVYKYYACGRMDCRGGNTPAVLASDTPRSGTVKTVLTRLAHMVLSEKGWRPT